MKAWNRVRYHFHANNSRDSKITHLDLQISLFFGHKTPKTVSIPRSLKQKSQNKAANLWSYATSDRPALVTQSSSITRKNKRNSIQNHRMNVYLWCIAGGRGWKPGAANWATWFLKNKFPRWKLSDKSSREIKGERVVKGLEKRGARCAGVGKSRTKFDYPLGALPYQRVPMTFAVLWPPIRYFWIRHLSARDAASLYAPYLQFRRWKLLPRRAPFRSASTAKGSIRASSLLGRLRNGWWLLAEARIIILLGLFRPAWISGRIDV